VTSERQTRQSRFLDRVRGVVRGRVDAALGPLQLGVDLTALHPGKMLRSRFGGRIIAAGVSGVDEQDALKACAAIELVHTASLCHDDVIDNGLIRRARPTFWQTTTASGAILVGDILLCEAMRLVGSIRAGVYVDSFLAKVSEVCQAEARQELQFRGRRLSADQCLEIARGKTGPLFAFVGEVSAGTSDPELAYALEEAGYRIGTAYQLGDDLLDLAGREEDAGKTLGTDRLRGKATLPSLDSDDGGRAAARRICEVITRAVAGLDPWPAAHAAVQTYVRRDLEPVMLKQLGPCCCLEPEFGKAI